jgi:hypothetical protein
LAGFLQNKVDSIIYASWYTKKEICARLRIIFLSLQFLGTFLYSTAQTSTAYNLNIPNQCRLVSETLARICNACPDKPYSLQTSASASGNFRFLSERHYIPNTNSIAPFINGLTDSFSVSTMGLFAYNLLIRRDSNFATCNDSITAIVSKDRDHPITITEQPISQTDCYYNTVVFRVGFASTGSINYQWESNAGSGWTLYGSLGNTSISPIKLSIDNIGANGINLDGTLYRVILSDEYDTIVSQTAILTVNEISGISPKNTQTVLCVGGNFSFTANTAGLLPISYQWLRNGNPLTDGILNGITISGSNTPSLNVTNASTSESGSYQIRVIYNVFDGVSIGKTCQITSQLTRNVTVNPLPTAFLISSDEDNVICTGQIVTFTGSGGTSYNFRVNGTSVQNNISDTYSTTALINGQNVDVIVTSDKGCSATSTSITTSIVPYPSSNPIINN